MRSSCRCTASVDSADLAALSPAIDAAVADATAAAALVQEAAAARTHATLIAEQATAATSQALTSATNAANEVHSLAGRLDLTASDRGQEHAAATIASDAAQEREANIGHAQAAPAGVGVASGVSELVWAAAAGGGVGGKGEGGGRGRGSSVRPRPHCT